MKREIKFRVWDGKKMYLPKNETIFKNASFWQVGVSDGETIYKEKIEQFSIMQFTELYDKNGNEIYEGDIIKCGMHKGSEEYFHRYAVVEFNPDIQFRILFYVNSETGEKNPTDNYIFHFGKFAYKETNKHIEIIGNIFENADLVKL